jgi:hypothetical protein
LYEIAWSMESASALGLSFESDPTQACFDTNSPTTAQRRASRDRKASFQADARPTTAWRRYPGCAAKAKLPYGSFHEKGPGPLSPHAYQLCVEALDIGGKAIAQPAAIAALPVGHPAVRLCGAARRGRFVGFSCCRIR